MKPIRILVISPEMSVGSFLEGALPVSQFRVLNSTPGPSIMEPAHQADIAVIDSIDERPDVAQLEIAMLKNKNSKMPIIVISRNSSDQDIRVVEQGVFYYLAGEPEQKLIRIIHAAAATIEKTSTYQRN